MQFVGLREVTSNRSWQIDFWANRLGIPQGSHWCMSFQWNVEEDIARAFGWKNPLLKTGSCFKQLQYAKRLTTKGLRVIPCGGIAKCPTANPGDLAIMSSRGVRVDLIGGQWTGHVKRVIEDQGAYVLAVGGNERNEVRISRYPKTKILALIRRVDS